MGDLRPMRKHCASTHWEEYIWNVCPTREEDSKRIPLSVAWCLIKSAFKTAAMQLPLPEGEDFSASWCSVRMLMCACLVLA
jgi:hypothetical protein